MPRKMQPARAEAIKAGARRFRGDACQRGHDGERYTSTGACCACQAGLTRDWRQAARGQAVADDFAALL